jgi:two-component system sensor histidine kinase UhpB
MTIALAPAILVLAAVNVSMYVVAQQEVEADIRARGRLIAIALAESTQYGVISGNVAIVDRTVHGVMTTDPSIVSIQVLDTRRKAIVAIEQTPAMSGAQTFEVPVEAGSLGVNLFDATGAPHLAFGAESRPAAPPGQTAGYVRVVMSPVPLLEAKRNRLVLASGVALLVGLVCIAIAVQLARRMRDPLDRVMGGLRSIRRGEYEIDLGEKAGGEIGELQSTILEMTQGLKLKRQDMEQQVASRTQALQAAMEQAQAADAEKRRLIERANVLIEEERRRISTEIHDDLNAALIAIKLQAQALAADSDEQAADVKQAAGRIAAIADDLYERARRIVKQLRPEVIDTLGLRGAIEDMVSHVDEIHPACRFEAHIDDDLPSLDADTAIAIYRVVQEALSNVIKHAQATRCRVWVTAWHAGEGIQVVVDDDGIGFATGRVGQGGVGLVGMRERAASAGGEMVVFSQPNLGAKITIRMRSSPKA